MQILYNEEEMGYKIYKGGFSNNQYNFREALLVAKHMRHVLGYKDVKVKSRLLNFCTQQDKFFNHTLHISQIRDIVKKSKDNWLKRDTITVYTSEIEEIRNKIKDFTAQKLFLGLFLIAKRNNNNFISIKQWKNVKKILNLRISNKKFYELIHLLYRSKMVEPVRKKYDTGHFLNMSFQDVGEVFFSTHLESDLYKIPKLYQKYCGGELGYCEICQEEFIRKNFREKYCKTHKKEMELGKHKKYNSKRN